MNKDILNFIIKMTLILGIISLTATGLILELDTAEVISGDGVLGMSLIAMINKKGVE